MKSRGYFHGDVTLIQVDQIPEEAKKCKLENGKIVIREGEMTGHAHTIEGINLERSESYVDENGNLYLKVKEPIEIQHQEHDSKVHLVSGEGKAKIAPGIYKIPHDEPRTFDFFQEQARRVSD